MTDSHIQLLQVEQPQTKYICYYAFRRVMLNICLGASFVGYSYTYFNSIPYDQFAKQFGITDHLTFYKGFLSFLTPFGAALGAIVCQFIIQHFSRKNSFVFVGAVSVVFTLLLQIRWVWALVIGRIVQGMAAGIYYIILSIYVKQFNPIELVGKFGPLIQLSFTLGMVYTYAQTWLFEMFMQVHTYWRIVYFMPVIVLSIQIYNIETKYPYQTPKYLVQHGRKEEARDLLKLFLKPQYVQPRIRELEHYCQLLKNYNFQQEVQSSYSRQSQISNQMQQNPQIAQKSQNNPLPVIAAYHLSILQQMTAIQVIYIYVGEIIHEAYPSMAKFLPVLIHGEGVIAIFLTITFIEYIGHKTILQIGTLGCSICLFLISFSFFSKQNDTNHTQSHAFANFLIVFALFGFRAVFSFTIAPIHPTYLAQIVEPKHVAYGSLLMFIFAGIISFIFPIMVEWFGGPAVPFLVFALYSLFSFMANIWLLIETKGKTQVEIHKEFRAKLQAFTGKTN